MTRAGLGALLAVCSVLVLGPDRAGAAFSSAALGRRGGSTCGPSTTSGARRASPIVADGGKEPADMRAAQIRAELQERRIPFKDCFDKESLVERCAAIRPWPSC